MSRACLKIAALWERWEQVPAALALGPGSSFLSSKFQSPFPLLAVLSPCHSPLSPPSLLTQPGGSSFCSVSHLQRFQKSCFWERGCVQSVCSDDGFLISKCAPQGKTLQFVLAVLSVSYWVGATGECFQGLLAQPPLGRFSHGWRKQIEI